MPDVTGDYPKLGDRDTGGLRLRSALLARRFISLIASTGDALPYRRSRFSGSMRHGVSRRDGASVVGGYLPPFQIVGRADFIAS